MSWRAAKNHELELINQVREENPAVLDLAQCLILAPRIEPLLLRNARLEFTPQLQAEVESLLWFSPLIAARSNSEIILHQGVASALAANQAAEDLDELWQFTFRHTRHWTAEDRLERDLRYYALRDDLEGIETGVGSILRRLHADINDEERIELSRLAKRILPVITHNGQKSEETRVLANYAAQALGDSNSWINPDKRQALPQSLKDKLPAALDISRLLAEIHQDAEHGQVIAFTEASADSEAIEFATPLPARLYIEPAGQPGHWHSVGNNTRIKIDQPAASFVLATLEGRQWELSAERYEPVEESNKATKQDKVQPLILSYFKADYADVEKISKWLHDQGIPCELHEESPRNVYQQDPDDIRPIVRIWSRNAEKYWQAQSTEETEYLPEGLFLRLDDVEPPMSESGRASLIDWPGLEHFDSVEQQLQLQQALRSWMEHPQELLNQAEFYTLNQSQKPSDETAESETEALDNTLPTVWISWGFGSEEWAYSIRQQLHDQGLKCIDRETVVNQNTEQPLPIEGILPTATALLVIHSLETMPLMKGDPRIDEANLARRFNIPVFHLASHTELEKNALYQSAETIWPIDDIERITADYIYYWVDIHSLLAEIENPDTKPERRLEIGDRLDEIGDPRPGVGTIEIEVPGPDPQAQTRTSPVDELLAELDNPETQPERRLKIGDELNDMPGGDPRFGVGLNADSWPEIDWVNIPAGEFIYGKDSDEEKRYLDAFEIARYPVTNAQYQAFVDDKGYDDERWWTGLEKPQKEPSEWPQGNRPKTNVDWYEATAFTRWLSYRLGYSVTLPHETQWERAARGQQGRVYPWGAEYLSGYANVNEKRNKDGAYFLEQTTAIGVYRHASTQEGVLDTSGNVWEWCRNDFDKPDEEVEVPSLPVMRGGGWYFNPDFARAALRSLNLPDSRSYNFGFRLLRSPPS